MPCSTCPTEKVLARGMCQACYYRLRRTGSVERINVSNAGKSCSEEGCTRKAFAKGLCGLHYDRAQHPLKTTWTSLRSRYPGEYPAAWERFDAFLSDVGERPGERHQLRRNDAKRPWAVDNIRWVEPVVVLDHYSPEERSVYERAWRFKTKFGITTADYERMFTEQNGLCAICDQPPTTAFKTGKVIDLAVDHDHDTGAVRGLLCYACNTALGMMNDDPERLSIAIAYLNKHQRPSLVCDAPTSASSATESVREFAG